MTSVLPSKTLFHVMDWVFKFNMKCAMTYGSAPPGSVVKVTDGVFLACNTNLYRLGEQILESAILQFDTRILFIGVGNIPTVTLENLVGSREVVVLLNFEHHHKWLTQLMNKYPDATITGSRIAFHKHTTQLGVAYTYTPPDQVQWPQDVACVKMDGVADEEYAVIHKKYAMLFSAHFYANADHFAGMESKIPGMGTVFELVLWSSKAVIGWNDWPTDNPVLDKEANELCKKKMIEAHGDWTTVHASHAGFVWYPKFEDTDTDHDGKLTKKDFRAKLGKGWTMRFEDMDVDGDGFVSMEEYAAVYGTRSLKEARYRGATTEQEPGSK
eukprot:CAMPEP_0168496186 /NCGR_PEP_ID=MMETSP0228-20121227/72128_1 /TAXON_ID=133427 /ORGANISM="Protoceratium reticulatum, Strain CCCM 535 (=CCMP 1889)" /LENGTH=326 /DNA_ID=CAMNT_0008513039 /DNA_START=110 /DNA_END=1090 /DNA_ORIENTATION=+